MLFGLFKNKEKPPVLSQNDCEQMILDATHSSNLAINSDAHGAKKPESIKESRQLSFDTGRAVTLCAEMPEPLRTYWSAHFIARCALLDGLAGELEKAASQYCGAAQVLENQLEPNATARNETIAEATEQFAEGMYYTAAECLMYAADALMVLDPPDGMESIYGLYNKAGALAMATDVYSPHKRLYVVHGVTLGLCILPWEEINEEVFGLITQYAGDTINLTTAALDWGTTLEAAMLQLPELAELVDLYALLLSVNSKEAMHALKEQVNASGAATPWRDAEDSAYQHVAMRLDAQSTPTH